MRPFESIVEEHGARVLRVCRALVGWVDADDAWSETFLAALTAYPQLAADSNVQAWLVTIAHRKGIDLLRGRARAPVPTAEVPDRPGNLGIPGGGDPDLWSAVAALPERQRHAVAYHYLGGLSHKETAQLVGGSSESIRRAASDGIAALRSIYSTPEGSTHEHTTGRP